jgi:hypothetical protein
MRRSFYWLTALFVNGMIPLVLLGCTSRPGEESNETATPQLDTVYMSRVSAWKVAPPEAEIEESSAGARVFMLSSDGKFSLVECTVRKFEGKVSISPGDGEKVYLGSWTKVSGEIQLKYVKILESISSVDGIDAPFKFVRQSRITRNNGVFRLDGSPFELIDQPADSFKRTYVIEMFSRYGDQAYNALGHSN